MSELQKRILTELCRGPVDLMTLADQLGIAPFYVRAELRSLRRSRLVRNRFGATGWSQNELHIWELTNRGWALINQANQLRLT